MEKYSYEKICMDDRAISYVTDGDRISFFGFILIDDIHVGCSSYIGNLDNSGNHY